MAAVAMEMAVLALVLRNRGVESGVLATTTSAAMRVWRRRRWGLAVQLLQAAVGVSVQGDCVVTVDAWPWEADRHLNARGRRLPDDEAWYWVAARLPRQVAALAFAPRVQSRWWLDQRPHLGSEELGGLIRLGNGAGWAFRWQSTKVPAGFVIAEEEVADSDIISVVSHSVTSIFGSDSDAEMAPAREL
eukprot:s2006_g13.t1